MDNPLFNSMKQLAGANLGTNPILQMAMNLLKSKSPNAFNEITNMMNNGTNPKEIVIEKLKGATPDQIAQFENLCRQFGVPDSIVKDVERKI